ncbi:MAG: 16S rRNA (cytidine(1402)-2'-O)-methyltransferase [Burkholderiaceae bacterium]
MGSTAAGQAEGLGLALAAAHAACSRQQHPGGTLYMVATPIGNLADISLRALHVLALADTVACEDTRHTQSLLRAYGIDKSGAQCLALHQHNEAQAAHTVIERLQRGQRVAYVSDAGTPAISDPGARLVASVQAAGLRVSPLPGASSVTAALSVAGLAAAQGALPGGVAAESGSGDAHPPAGALPEGFVFAGFLPSKAQAREAAIALLAREPRAVVLLEAPHRIEALAAALAVLGPRELTLARELSKQFEDIARLPAAQLSAWLAAQPQRTRGEFVLVLHPSAAAAAAPAPDRLLALLLAELPLKTAVKLVAEISGQPRNALYAQALGLQAAALAEGGSAT